jgi:hypothetical protein
MRIAQPLIDRYGLNVQAIEAMEREEERGSRRRAKEAGNAGNAPWAVEGAVKRLRQLLQIEPAETKDGISVMADDPALIFCTHRALRLLEPHPRLANWHVIQDEVTDPVDAPPLKLIYDNLNLLTDRFSLWSGVLDGYYYFDARALYPVHELTRVQKLRGMDQVYEEILMKVVEPYQQGAAVFVPQGVWDRAAGLTRGQPKKKPDPDDPDPEPRTRPGELHVAYLQSPEYVRQFKSYTIMSAAFRESLLYKAWTVRYRVNWVPHPDIVGTYTHHDMAGRKVLIGYLCDHILTKSQRDQWEAKYAAEHPGSVPKTLLQAVVETAERWFDLGDVQIVEDEDQGDHPAIYLFVANKDVLDGRLPLNRLRERMPNVSHGRNSWRFVNQMLFFSALNPTTMAARFIRLSCQMTDQEIMASRTYATVYQAALRTSARNDTLTAEQRARPLRFLVPDRATAEWLATWFINCDGGGGPEVMKVGDLYWEPPGEAGRPALGEKAMTTAERQRRYREGLDPEAEKARKAKEAEAAKIRRARKKDEQKGG